MNGPNRELFAHLAVALGRYVAELRRDGLSPPSALLERLTFYTDCARARPDATPLADPSVTGDGEPMTKHLMLTKREAAAELRVSVRQLERVLANPESGLESVRVERGVRVRRADLDAYVDSLGPPRSFRDQIEEKAG